MPSISFLVIANFPKSFLQEEESSESKVNNFPVLGDGVSHRGALPGCPNWVVSSRPQATTTPVWQPYSLKQWFMILGELIVCVCSKMVKYFLHQQHLRVILN